MTPKEVVFALYEAYRSRDPERIAAMLHPDVVWVAPPGNATQVAFGLGSADDAGPPTGANNLRHEQIVRFIAHNWTRLFSNPRVDIQLAIAEGNTVVLAHRLSATLPNGRSYVNDYCFVYETEGERVMKIREYMDTHGGWVQVFGCEPPGSTPRRSLGSIRATDWISRAHHRSGGQARSSPSRTAWRRGCAETSTGGGGATAWTKHTRECR
jgi:uncharacterized protein